MRQQKMNYPAASPFETARQRNQRAALSRAVEQAGDALPAGRRQSVARATPAGLVMTFASFKAADYGSLCQFLGLSPSRPRSAQRTRTHKTSA